MLCAIYKSKKKDQMYLYVKTRDNFECVPEALLKQFGVPQLVSVLNLTADKKLALADTRKVMSDLNVLGFYLQLPPPPINYLTQYKESQEKIKHLKKSKN
jgi:uncharacterized protein YcgL (UPF0745 family)